MKLIGYRVGFLKTNIIILRWRSFGKGEVDIGEEANVRCVKKSTINPGPSRVALIPWLQFKIDLYLCKQSLIYHDTGFMSPAPRVVKL